MNQNNLILQKTKNLLCFVTRPEGVEYELSALAGANKQAIVDKSRHYLTNDFNPKNENPYGEGKASGTMAHFIQKISK